MPKFYLKCFLILLLFPFLSFGVKNKFSWNGFENLQKDQCKKTFEIIVQIENKDPRYGSPKSLSAQIDKHILHLAKLPDYMDHTLLKPEAKRQDIQKLVDEALSFNFKAVCVSPCQVPLVKELLQNTDQKEEKPLIATVIGFPTGSHLTKSKIFESIEAYKQGANELDMVINIGFIKDKRFQEARNDIKQVVELTPLPVKVILETGLLTKEEIVIASKIAEEAGAHFVKTSTGFSKGGATVENIQLIKASVSPNIKIKASGGIRDIETALQLLDAGADRLGLSSSVPIMKSRNEIIKPILEL